MNHFDSRSLELAYARVILEPFVQDLHDWRIEMQRLFDRTKAAQDAQLIDLSLFEQIELARDGLDMQIEVFDALVDELGGEDSVVAGQLSDLHEGFRSLRLAADRIAGILDEMRADEGPVIESEAVHLED
ncbi:MAG: hypothetical protein ACTHOR_07020 [Devosia sp.]|nr:hypothetical protein [Devosiaceae bacterium]